MENMFHHITMISYILLMHEIKYPSLPSSAFGTKCPPTCSYPPPPPLLTLVYHHNVPLIHFDSFLDGCCCCCRRFIILCSVIGVATAHVGL